MIMLVDNPISPMRVHRGFFCYDNFMRLTFYGAAGIVTGSNYLLESGKTKILIDCGLHQGSNFCEKRNFEPFPYKPKNITAVFVTHAHIDHTGRLPQLYRNGFKGTVYSTPPTKDFSELLLIDSEHIIDQEAKRFHKKVLYNTEDVNGLMAHWQGLDYHKVIQIGPFKVTLYNAGHILGSAIIVIEANGKRIVFSGDLGNTPSPLINATDILDKADYCVMESTYGDRLHEDLNIRKEMLEDAIEGAVRAKGVLMIPAFAMERTQELLFDINTLVDQGSIPRVPTYIDSPLAIKLTSVYKKYESYYNLEALQAMTKGDGIFNFPGLHTSLTTEESKAINDTPAPKVIIAGSGMSNGGRILHHERRYLSDPKSAILFIGYQAAGTLGRKILEGAKTIKIFDEEISVNCKVIKMSGYSAHADQAQLMNWLYPMRESLQKIFLVHGEESNSKVLAQKIADELAVSAIVPTLGESYDII